jgi:hypothetical protein
MPLLVSLGFLCWCKSDSCAAAERFGVHALRAQFPGLSSGTIFGSPPFFNQLAADLQKNETLLAALRAANSPLEQDNNSRARAYLGSMQRLALRTTLYVHANKSRHHACAAASALRSHSFLLRSAIAWRCLEHLHATAECILLHGWEFLPPGGSRCDARLTSCSCGLRSGQCGGPERGVRLLPGHHAAVRLH